MNNLLQRLSPFHLLVVYVLLPLLISLQQFLLGPKTIEGWNHTLTHYNVYLIFKDSYYHLIHLQDLYQYWPDEHWDLFKYSPTFALLMAPFAWLPDYLGLPLWNLLNSLVLFQGIRRLPGMAPASKNLVGLFVLVELSTSLQNSQSNALLAGLLLLGFSEFEKGNSVLATFFMIAGGFIKIYGFAGLGLALFYPNKLKNAALSLVWILIFLLLPLAVIPPAQLLFLYQSWKSMLSNDHSVSYGLSVQGLFQVWLGLGQFKDLILLLSMGIFGWSCLQIKQYTNQGYRLLCLASLLVWLVLFNHKAESPTYIIALAGIGVWYFSKLKPNRIDTILLGIALVFGSLSATDLFPSAWRNGFFYPYNIKALACFPVWIKILYDAFTLPVLSKTS